MKLYNARTYWAVFVSWVQAWGGWIWNLPARVIGRWRMKTGRIALMERDDFAAWASKSVARVQAAEETRLAKEEVRRAQVRATLTKASMGAGSQRGYAPGEAIPEATCGVCRSPLYIGPRGWECRNAKCEDEATPETN